MKYWDLEIINLKCGQLSSWQTTLVAPSISPGEGDRLINTECNARNYFVRSCKNFENRDRNEKVLATTGLEPASPGRPWQESNPRLWTSRWPAPSLGPHSQELYHWATRPAIKLGQISRIARPVCNPCRYSRFPNFETSRQNLCWKGPHLLWPLCLSSSVFDSAS